MNDLCKAKLLKLYLAVALQTKKLQKYLKVTYVVKK